MKELGNRTYQHLGFCFGFWFLPDVEKIVHCVLHEISNSWELKREGCSVLFYRWQIKVTVTYWRSHICIWQSYVQKSGCPVSSQRLLNYSTLPKWRMNLHLIKESILSGWSGSTAPSTLFQFCISLASHLNVKNSQLWTNVFWHSDCQWSIPREHIMAQVMCIMSSVISLSYLEFLAHLNKPDLLMSIFLPNFMHSMHS